MRKGVISERLFLNFPDYTFSLKAYWTLLLTAQQAKRCHLNTVLTPERQAKLDKELEEIDNAQQYALVATANKHYPCYTCPNGAKTIFLNIGEIWRYGVVRSASLSMA